MNRRSFLAKTLASLAAAAASVPLLSALFAPLRRAKRAEAPFTPIGEAVKLKKKEPRLVVYTEPVADAWETRPRPRSVYVTHLGGDEFRVQSPACPHLGCTVAFDKTDKCFRCPCHDSRFEKDGAATAGPSARGLDELPYKVEGGKLLVQWVDFELDTKEKRPR